MDNLFQPNMEKGKIDAISNLGLAHIGDGVYELLCRSWLCIHGNQTVKRLHRDSVELVKAPTHINPACPRESSPKKTLSGSFSFN